MEVKVGEAALHEAIQGSCFIPSHCSASFAHPLEARSLPCLCPSGRNRGDAV